MSICYYEGIHYLSEDTYQKVWNEFYEEESLYTVGPRIDNPVLEYKASYLLSEFRALCFDEGLAIDTFENWQTKELSHHFENNQPSIYFVSGFSNSIPFQDILQKVDKGSNLVIIYDEGVYEDQGNDADNHFDAIFTQGDSREVSNFIFSTLKGDFLKTLPDDDVELFKLFERNDPYWPKDILQKLTDAFSRTSIATPAIDNLFFTYAKDGIAYGKGKIFVVREIYDGGLLFESNRIENTRMLIREFSTFSVPYVDCHFTTPLPRDWIRDVPISIELEVINRSDHDIENIKLEIVCSSDAELKYSEIGTSIIDFLPVGKRRYVEFQVIPRQHGEAQTFIENIVLHYNGHSQNSYINLYSTRIHRPIKKATPPEAINFSERLTDYKEYISQDLLLNTMASLPIVAITRCGVVTEKILKRIYKEKISNDALAPYTTIKALEKKKVIKDPIIGYSHAIRELYNSAKHGGDYEPTAEDALLVVSLFILLMEQLTEEGLL